MLDLIADLNCASKAPRLVGKLVKSEAGRSINQDGVVGILRRSRSAGNAFS